MVIQIKLKTIQYISADDARNIYGYILARWHNNIFLQSEQKMN